MAKMTFSEAGKLGGTIGGAKTKIMWQQKYLANPKFCKHCNIQLSWDQRSNKFCSKSCAASHNNKGHAHNFVNGKKAKKDCVVCGNITCNEKFCSRQCFQTNRWNEYVSEIETTGRLPATEHKIYGYTPLRAKRYLTNVRGHCCEICKNTTWCNKPIPLVLDHISGDPEDHSLTNLRLVCGNCNMQLPTFAGRNVGKGRKNRK